MKNLRPFDLERAKAGDPIQAFEGTPAVFVAHVPEARAMQRIVYRIGQTIRYCREDGYGYSYSIPVLQMAPIKKQAWVNLYEDQGAVTPNWAIMAFRYDTQEEADNKNRRGDAVRIGNKAHLIEWEE